MLCKNQVICFVIKVKRKIIPSFPEEENNDKTNAITCILIA